MRTNENNNVLIFLRRPFVRMFLSLCRYHNDIQFEFRFWDLDNFG